MKRVVGLLIAALLTSILAGPAFAQQQSPKATERPDAKKQEPKGTEDPDVCKEPMKQ